MKLAVNVGHFRRNKWKKNIKTLLENFVISFNFDTVTICINQSLWTVFLLLIRKLFFN